MEVKDEREQPESAKWSELSEDTRESIDSYIEGRGNNFTPEEIEEIKAAMTQTEEPLYRVEDMSWMAENLETGDTFTFDKPLKSFSQDFDGVHTVIAEGEDAGLYGDQPVVIFETQGTTDHLDVSGMSRNHEEEHESLVGGTFRVVDEFDGPTINGRETWIMQIEQVENERPETRTIELTDPVQTLSKGTRSALEDYTGGEELHLDQKQFDEIKDAMQETERPQYRVESASRTFEKDELEEGDTFNFAQRVYESKDAEEGALRSFTQEERCLSDLVGQVDDPVIFRTNGQVDVLPIDSISGYDQAETLVFADGWKVTGTDMMEIDGKYYTVCDIEHVDPKTVVAIEEPKPEPRPIVQGSDISETWERRKSEFNTEIEDVINTQGFDGNPQLVGREEFDKAVQESGFVAQRSYSAPDKETLEAYREQLYNGGQGNWYVDCGTGGAQYGQGMYCAADYTGTITDGMQEEMKHYTELGESRYKTAQSDFAEKVYQDEMAKVELPIDEKYRDALTDEFGITELGTKTTSEDREFVREWMKDHPKEASELKEEYAAAQRRGVEKGTEIEHLTKEEFTEKYPEHAPQSYTETITLTPDAKIITYDDALKLQQEYRNGHSYETSKSIARDAVLEELGIAGRDKIDAITLMNLYNSPATKKTMDRISTLEGKLGMGKDGRPKTYDVIRLIDTRTTALRKNVMTDIGSIVAAHGYDAINAQGHGESGSYTVILNRTKTIILDGRK